MVTAKSAYWWGYSQGVEDVPVAGTVTGGPSVRPSGELRLEVEVIDSAGGSPRTEEVIIDPAPEPGVAGLVGIGMVLAVLRRRRGLRE